MTNTNQIHFSTTSFIYKTIKTATKELINKAEQEKRLNGESKEYRELIIYWEMLMRMKEPLLK